MDSSETVFVSIGVYPWFNIINREPGSKEPRMDMDSHGLINEDETRQIIGCAMEVLNGLGHGLLEKPYENALVVEFGLRGVPFKQQPRYDVVYKSVRVGEYIPDLIVCL